MTKLKRVGKVGRMIGRLQVTKMTKMVQRKVAKAKNQRQRQQLH